MNRIRVLLIYVMMCLSHSYQLSALPSTLWAASPSFADVSAAVSNAKAGDTVIVPAGSANWGANYISTTKALSIIGAGIGQTNITGSGSFFFAFYPDATAVASDARVRVSGFTLNGNYASGSGDAVLIEQHTSSIMHNFIVDHVNFYHCVAGIGIKGNIYGVAYSCHFEYTDPTAGPRNCCIFLCALGNDRESWDDYYPDPASPYGHGNNFFIEDCTFEGNHWCEAGHGGRYVLRYNTFNHQGIGPGSIIQCFDYHGNQSGPLYGSIVGEVYNNTFTNAQQSIEFVSHRGGHVVVHHNTITGKAGIIALSKVYDDFDDFPGPPDPTRHGCINGTDFVFDSYHTWPVKYPALERMTPLDNYNWLNRVNGAPFAMWLPPQTYSADGLRSFPDPGNVLGENKTFWNEKLSFDGTVGVGVGPLSACPASCTMGVGYWATDTNTLYRATAPNTWTAYYTPYTYPHPLRKR